MLYNFFGAGLLVAGPAFIHWFAVIDSNKMAQSRAKTSNYYPALPKLELLIYCAVWSIAILWSIGSLLSVSKDNETRYLSYNYLGTGWYHWIGRHKDKGDFEWEFWESGFLVSVVIGFMGHFIVARIADKFYPRYRFDIYCVYSIIFSSYYLGIPGFMFLVTHFVIQYTVAKLTKSSVACWISGCLLAYSLTAQSVETLLRSCYPENDFRTYFVLFTAGMCNLRYISFSVEYVWSLSHDHDKSQNTHSQKHNFFAKLFRTHRDDRKDDDRCDFSFKDLMVYQMYYPLCYGGPVINYNDFFIQLKKAPLTWNSHNLTNFTLGMARIIFWHIFLKFLLHFFYIPTMATDHLLISKLPWFNILGLGLGMVLFFCLKYICMYGLTSHFSSSDNLDVPGPPHCIFVKHRMTDMWKFFDKGLHLWLVRYIYVPLGGSRVPFLRLILNSVMPFAFVFLWHGPGLGQAHWAFWSWVGVLIESISYRLYKADSIISAEAKFLTPAWSRRIRAFLSTPLLCLLMISNLFFLMSYRQVLLYCSRLFLENLNFLAFALLFLYAWCQTSMEFHRMGVGM